MINFSISNQLPQFLATNGTGLNNGKVYIGMPNQDPQTFPKTVYWDEAGTDPVDQTNGIPTIGGYITRAGSPATIYVSGYYSIRVLDRFGAQVYYFPEVFDLATVLASPTGADFVGIGQTTLGVVTPITPQQFGAAGNGSTDDGPALASALADLATLPYPGGTIKFPGMQMSLGTSTYVMGDEVDLDLGRTWIYANPVGPGHLFSYGWGTTGTANAIARPRVTGGNIRLSGIGRTAFAFENCDSPLIRDTSIDLLAASQVGVYVKGLNNPFAPYYGVLDNVRVSGGSNPVPGDGRIGILFEAMAAQGSVGPNRWIFSNLRHIAAVDYGIDIRGADGMVGSNINLEACYEAAIRFGFAARNFTGNITAVTGLGAGGFTVGGLAGTTLDASGSIIVNTGANIGFSLPILTLNPTTGEIVLPYGLPYAFAVGDNVTYTEPKARSLTFTNVTYEGSSFSEDFVLFTAGAKSCKVGTAFLTMPTGFAFRREVEDASNSIATHYETFYYEGPLTASDGTQWMDPSHVSSTQGGWTVPEGGAWIDSVIIAASVRSPDSQDGVFEADVFVNGVSQGLKPILTRLSPNYATRVRKSLIDTQFVSPNQAIKVLITKSGGVAYAEYVRVAVRVGFIG